jgi:hypothetical protein
VYFSHNGGTDWTKVNGAAVNAADLTWNWAIDETIPLTAGKTGLIRIYNTSDASVYDTSNAAFEIKGALSVNAPSAVGISMNVGDTYNISWTKYGNIANVKLYYSTNGGIGGGGDYPGGNLIDTVAGNSSPYAWTVPDRVGSNLRIYWCRMRPTHRLRTNPTIRSLSRVR